MAGVDVGGKGSGGARVGAGRPKRDGTRRLDKPGPGLTLSQLEALDRTVGLCGGCRERAAAALSGQTIGRTAAAGREYGDARTRETRS